MRFDAILCEKKLCFLGVLWSASSLAPAGSHIEVVTNGAVSERTFTCQTLLTSRCPRRYSPEPGFQLRK